MNEIKRQLDEKMGDTKGRAHHLITKINKEKMQSTRKKSSSSIPYFLTLGSFAALIVLLFLIGPYDLFQNTADNPNEKTEDSTINTDDLKSYFRKSGDVAYYEGIGSEIASYKVETAWLADQYVQHIVENDGAFVQRIFRITEDEVQFIYNQEVLEPAIFEAAELDQLPVISILLKTPLEDGNTFDGKIVSFPETVDTPIGSFDNAVKISEQMEDGVNQVYYVPNEGIVKTVYSFDDGNEIASVLRTVSNENQQTLNSFFRKSGDIAYYIGTGYAHASYSLETTWLAENYVQTIHVNDATAMQFIYRISADEIQLVYSGNAEQNAARFELTALDQLPVISVVLKMPFENGEIDGKTVSFPETVDTPIGTFENAIKVSEKSEGSTSHTYYVPNEGIVKSIFAHDIGGEIVTVLASIGSPPKPADASDLPDSISAKVSTTTNSKTILLNEHPMLQQILISKVGFEDINKIPFTYTPLVTGGNSSKFGMLQFDCAKETCYLLFMKETEDRAQSLFIDAGTPDQSLKISPDGTKAMLGIQAYEYDSEDSRISRNRIALIDLQTLELIYPPGSEQYFDSILWPILEYEWLDADTIRLVTADAENHFHETIAAWEKIENAPVKELKIKLR